MFQRVWHLKELAFLVFIYSWFISTESSLARSVPSKISCVWTLWDDFHEELQVNTICFQCHVWIGVNKGWYQEIGPTGVLEPSEAQRCYRTIESRELRVHFSQKDFRSKLLIEAENPRFPTQPAPHPSWANRWLLAYHVLLRCRAKFDNGSLLAGVRPKEPICLHLRQNDTPVVNPTRIC